ncbi:MAG TPA: glycosyl transferase [Eubacteriaceae bacterium]|nr:glycosyl transferase [Eubacteriaceae bacterium]
MGQNKIISLLKRPQYLFLILGHRGFFKWMNDEMYLKIAYWCKMDKRLDLKHPTTYNEKLQWLKLNDRKPKYTDFVDKYEVRSFVKDKIGGEYLIPLLGIWDNVNEIDFDKLPKQFVLKCTHDSGSLVICTDKDKLDFSKAKKKLLKSLKHNYYWGQREWIYKDIKPRIIAEQFMVDESKKELKDYKFFCFNGEVKAMFIATDRGVDTRFDFFDLEFNHMPFMQHYPNANKQIKKPNGFEEMIGLAKVLSKDIPHVRVDFYDVNGKVYFGEMTFFHFSGWEKFEPENYDQIFGEWLKIPFS